MKIKATFYRFFRPQLTKVGRAIENGKTLIFVGINGLGKNLLAEQILSRRFKKEFLGKTTTYFVFLNLKDKPQPSKEQLLGYWLIQTAKVLKLKPEKSPALNDFIFYSAMERLIKKIGPKQKICFLVLDAQQILNQEESFFDCLTNLKYYSYGRLSYVFLAEPQILTCQNPGLKRFIQRQINHKFIFLPTFDDQTTLADIHREEKLFKTDFQKSYHLIIKHSEGLHGMVRALCLFLRKNPQVKSIKPLKKILFASQLYRFWIKEILGSLPKESLRILKTVSKNPREIKNYQKSLSAQWLFELGLLKKNGQIKHPLFLPVLKDLKLEGIKNQPPLRLFKNQFFFSGEKVNLTKKEFLILQALYKNRGKKTSFDRLGNVLWPRRPDDFSLWAITQAIRRLRKKFNYYFIDPKIIRSLRGEGYLLTNQ